RWTLRSPAPNRFVQHYPCRFSLLLVACRPPPPPWNTGMETRAAMPLPDSTVPHRADAPAALPARRDQLRFKITHGQFYRTLASGQRPSRHAFGRTPRKRRISGEFAAWRQSGVPSGKRKIVKGAPRITRGFSEFLRAMMTATEFGPISLATHRVSRRSCPVFASNRPRHRRFGAFRASEGLDSGLPEVDQSLQVVAGGHHRHREARPRLADGAQQLATHLLEGAEHVLDPGARFGDALVTPLLALGQRLVALAFPLDLIPEALLFEPGFTRLGRVAPVGIDIPARVGGIEDVVEVLAVVRTCRVGLDSANDLVFLVDVDRELVAEVTLAVLLRP